MDPSSPQVIVLGAAGRLGREFVRVGLRLGYTVTAVARDSGKLRAALGVPESSSLTLAEADARDVGALTSLMKGMSAVVNAAGHAGDGDAFVEIGRTVVQATEQALGPEGRLWFVGGLGVLRIPHTDRLGVDLAGMPAMYQTHRRNHETLRASVLDWSMLCPGPLIDTAEGPSLEELRITTEVMPFDVDVSDGPDDSLLFSRLRERFPETTIPYATAAEVAMRHLVRGGPFSRQRVGIALPVGRTAEKKGWKIGERG
ncbi:NAD(P)-dependent oxidoreductase [Stigmatella aurantiaca]|uniref:NADH-flavin reductase-like protein n=1 Tax=Stigmatella aurantiaca (strain DW4/3-1) TaxID=378806 RepID=E3FQZ8_STIAD|nr:NAD(P)-binding oxidoreductase [Stigmatella aurantiaca]ADO72031.1 NADH-flavin reductase-like protein [Stigmatella aurantiaca DW4/3-1]